MKVYVINDEVKKLQGKKDYTCYEYSTERDTQVRKRLARYRKLGYNVTTQQDWWTTINIVLVDKESK